MEASQETLKKYISILSNVVKAGATMPILEMVKITNDGLEGTNLIHTIVIRDVFGGMFKADFMPCLVNFTDFKRAVTSAPKSAGLIEFTRNDKERVLEISFARSKVKLPFLEADDFPEPNTELRELARVERTLFEEAAAMVPKFTGSDMLRPVMESVHFNGATFAATDAHKLAKFTVLPAAAANLDMNISPLAMQLVCSGNDEDIVMGERFMSCGNITVIYSSIEGKYPAYENVIPRDQGISAKVSKRELLGAVKVAQSTASNESQLARFTFTGQELIVKSEDIDKTKVSTTTLECHSNQPIVIGFALNYLEVILNALQDDELYIQMSAPNRAATFPFENGVLLQMPVMVADE
jgi:DNA polymerase III subunit beta